MDARLCERVRMKTNTLADDWAQRSGRERDISASCSGGSAGSLL